MLTKFHSKLSYASKLNCASLAVKLLMVTALETIFLFGCSNDVESPTMVLEPGLSSRNYSLSSVETIKLTDDVGTIRDMYDDKLIGLSSDKSTVWIYGLNDKSLKELRIKGEGPGKTGDILKVYWMDSDNFVLHDIKGAYLYDLEGNIVDKCGEVYKHMNVGTISSGFSSGNRKAIIPALNPGIAIKEQGYYNNKDIFFFTELTFGNCNVKIGGKDIALPTYSSKILPVRYRGYVENLNDENFFLFFQYEKLLWIYNKSSFQHIKTLKLIPDNFSEVQGAIEWSLQEMTRLAQINPAYMRMKTLNDGDMLITQYSESSQEFKSSLEYLDGEVIRPKRWLEIYKLDPDFEKVKEIELTTDIAVNPILFGTDNADRIFMYANEYNGIEGTFLISGIID